MKDETDIIASISASPIGRAVIMSVDTFKTDAIVFIGDVRLTDMRVTTWPTIFVDKAGFEISGRPLAICEQISVWALKNLISVVHMESGNKKK